MFVVNPSDVLTPDTYYYVYNPDGGKPSKRHSTYEDAEIEAKRIVATNAKEVVILKAVATIRRGEVPITVTKHKDDTARDDLIQPKWEKLTPKKDWSDIINPTTYGPLPTYSTRDQSGYSTSTIKVSEIDISTSTSPDKSTDQVKLCREDIPVMRKGEFSVISSHPSSGKSIYTDGYGDDATKSEFFRSDYRNSQE